MTTTLAAQLRILSRTGSEPDHRYKATKASFLFDSKVSAETDTETIFNLGLNGLSELQKVYIDNHPSSICTYLFSPQPCMSLCYFSSLITPYL